MIWTLVVRCASGPYMEEDCVRRIEIDSEASLLDLHTAIQEAVDFDDDHMFEFAAGRHPRNRKVRFDDGVGPEALWDTYAAITIEQVYPLPKNCKLFYHFDFGDDWFFQVTRDRRKPHEPEPGVRYPRVAEAIGPNPQQYPGWADQ